MISPDPVRRLNDLQAIAEMLYPDPPNVDRSDRIRRSLSEASHSISSRRQRFRHHW